MHRAIVLTILILACGAAPAGAATVSAVSPYVDAYKGSGDYDTLVTVRAAPGERNAIAIDNAKGLITVHDTGAPLTAAGGCVAQADGTVACAVKDVYSLGRVEVHAGDGDDIVTLDAGSGDFYGDEGDDAITGIGRLDGGPGDDTLTSTGGWTLFTGGPGADTITGTADGHDDFASYADHTAPVTVDLATGAPAGSAGEGDTLRFIDHVDGGSGDDTLVGDDGDNVLTGGPGIDHLSGGAGKDELVGATSATSSYVGADVEDGGDGDDELRAGRGASMKGGAGDDELDVGTDGTADGGPGADEITAHHAGRIVGGSGSDIVRADAGGRIDLAGDGAVDTIVCGIHVPTRITLDQRDVAQRCGPRVHRPRPGTVGLGTDLQFTRSGTPAVSAFGTLVCPDDARRGCDARITLRAAGRPSSKAGHQHARIRRGKSMHLNVALPERWRGVAKDGAATIVLTVTSRDQDGRLRTIRITRCVRPGTTSPGAC